MNILICSNQGTIQIRKCNEDVLWKCQKSIPVFVHMLNYLVENRQCRRRSKELVPPVCSSKDNKLGLFTCRELNSLKAIHLVK